jgi:hypothetical protein
VLGMSVIACATTHWWVGRFTVGRAFWLMKCILLPMEVCGRLPWARRPVSLATGLLLVTCIGTGADLFVLKRNVGGGIDDGAGVVRKRPRCVARFAVWSGALTPPAVWLRGCEWLLCEISIITGAALVCDCW